MSINMDDSKSNSCTAPWNEDCASRSPDSTTGRTPRTSSTAPENSSALAASRAADGAHNRIVSAPGPGRPAGTPPSAALPGPGEFFGVGGVPGRRRRAKPDRVHVQRVNHLRIFTHRFHGPFHRIGSQNTGPVNSLAEPHYAHLTRDIGFFALADVAH